MIDIVFDGPPSHESGRFVEVEDASGKSIKFGEWIKRDDGYWALRIPDSRDQQAVIDAARKLQDDMVLRADIGTYDGDHSVQAGYTVWSNFCVALAKLEKVDSE